MNSSATLSVSQLIGTSIHTREASKILMQRIENETCSFIELDFSNVDDISRSFADQFYFDKLNLISVMKKNIIISNANENVIRMLDAVSKSQNKKKRPISNIPIFKYSSLHQLENFLLRF